MTVGLAPEARTRHQTVAVATAFLALFSIVGCALYGLPFFYDFFVRDLGWSRQQVTSGNALSKLIVGPLFGFFAGWMVDRFGPKRLMLAGIVMAGGALVGLAQVTTLAGFYLFYFFNALGYVCGGPLPNQVLLSRWFDAARGKAMGIAYLGIGIGGALVPIVAHTLTQSLGWRGALRWLGVLMILVALPMALFVRDPGHGSPRITGHGSPRITGHGSPRITGHGSPGITGHGSPRTTGHGSPQITADTGSIGPVLRTREFYLLALGSMASIGAVGGTMQNLKLYLSLDRGLAQASIATTLSIVLVGSILGRLLMGWLADRWPKQRVMLLIYAIVAVSIAPLAFAPSTTLLNAFAFLFGIGLGGDYMIIPLMAAELFGLRVMGRLMGVVLTADGVAEAVTPMLVATIRDQTGSYGGGFLLLVGLAAVGAVAVSLLPRPAPPKPVA